MRRQTVGLGSLLFSVLGLFVLDGPVLAQNYRLFTHADGEQGSFGHAVSLGLDTDHDGFSEMVVAAPLDTLVEREVGRVSVYDGRSGLELYAVSGFDEGDWFGHGIALGEDWDVDGVPELIIGAPQGGTSGGGPCSGRGFVRIVSGADGTTIKEFTGPETCALFGFSVALAGDVDGDGLREIAVGAPQYQLGGAVFLYSPTTAGSPLVSIVSTSPNVGFGRSVASFPDSDGDGVADLLAGAPFTSVNGPQSGTGFLLSSAAGVPLRQWHGLTAREFFGTSIANVGDIDGDALDDIAVGGPQGNGKGTPNGTGFVRFFSGAPGQPPLVQLDGESLGDFFGASVAPAGDLNGDGRMEVVVGAPGRGIGGAAQVWTVLPNVPWQEVVSDVAGADFGYAVAGGSDINADGALDFVVGGRAGGMTQSFSTSPLSLQTDIHELSLTAGGQMVADLDVGPEYGGLAYYVLGSATGNVPGTFLINKLVPLNWGPYFCETIVYPNTGPLGNNLGSLDADGKGTMTFTVGAGSLGPIYVGLRLDHLMIAFQPSGVAPIQFVGEIAPLSLVE